MDQRSDNLGLVMFIWSAKFNGIIENLLSIITIKEEANVHCFAHVFVGNESSQAELSINLSSVNSKYLNRSGRKVYSFISIAPGGVINCKRCR